MQSSLQNKEFNINANKSYRLKLNEEYRSHYDNLKAMMDDPLTLSDDILNAVINIIEAQRRCTNNILKSLKRKYKDSDLKMKGVIASFIHMFINRLFISEQRHKEMVVYYWLTKYYVTLSALSTLSKKK